MTLKVGMQIDSEINFSSDNTVLLMREAQNRGYKLFHYVTQKLFLDCDAPHALVRELTVAENEFVFGDEEVMRLDSLDIVLMRQNPPFDMRYITATYMLEKCKRAVVINNPRGIRNCPEKLCFDPSLPTLVTEDLNLIEKFNSEHKELVIKPLYSYGGKNISYVKGDSSNVRVVSTIIQEIYDCPIMVQKFNSDILNGDKRVTILDGEILGVFSRIPKEGDFRANLSLGNKCKKSSLTASEQQVCMEIGKKLVENGIVLAGIDLIGECVIEVNVTSPTGLHMLNSLYDRAVEKECWDCFESKCKA